MRTSRGRIRAGDREAFLACGVVGSERDGDFSLVRIVWTIVCKTYYCYLFTLQLMQNLVVKISDTVRWKRVTALTKHQVVHVSSVKELLT